VSEDDSDKGDGEAVQKKISAEQDAQFKQSEQTDTAADRKSGK
jgi:hypothetical protein